MNQNNKITRKPNNEIPLRLLDAAEFFNSIEQWKIWKFLEEQDISKELQKKLLGKLGRRGDKDVERQKEYIDMITDSIEKVDETILEYQKDYEKAKKELQVAERNFQQAKKLLEKVARQKEIAINEKQIIKGTLEQEQKRLEKMKLFVLVHPTATMRRIQKKIDSTIVCTRFDADRMNLNYFPDKIEETESFAEIDLPKDAFSKFSSEVEKESAIQYVKMVLAYWADNKRFELLYHDEAIEYMIQSLELF